MFLVACGLAWNSMTCVSERALCHAASSCPGYDEDKYGLTNLGGSYMAQAGDAYIRSTFPTRYLSATCLFS